MSSAAVVPNNMLGLSLASDHLGEVVAKCTKKYIKAKLFAECNYLGKKTSKAVRGIVQQFPDIMNVIEQFVQDRNVGADV